VPKGNHVRRKPVRMQQSAAWNGADPIHVLVIDLTGQTVRILYRPMRLKGKASYKVSPDCDPTMW
jgi:hypothetical protein